jgi:hypothetical protein
VLADAGGDRANFVAARSREMLRHRAPIGLGEVLVKLRGASTRTTPAREVRCAVNVFTEGSSDL